MNLFMLHIMMPELVFLKILLDLTFINLLNNFHMLILSNHFLRLQVEIFFYSMQNIMIYNQHQDQVLHQTHKLAHYVLMIYTIKFLFTLINSYISHNIYLVSISFLYSSRACALFLEKSIAIIKFNLKFLYYDLYTSYIKLKKLFLYIKLALIIFIFPVCNPLFLIFIILS